MSRLHKKIETFMKKIKRDNCISVDEINFLDQLLKFSINFIHFTHFSPFKFNKKAKN